MRKMFKGKNVGKNVCKLRWEKYLNLKVNVSLGNPVSNKTRDKK